MEHSLIIRRTSAGGIDMYAVLTHRYDELTMESTQSFEIFIHRQAAVEAAMRYEDEEDDQNITVFCSVWEGRDIDWRAGPQDAIPD